MRKFEYLLIVLIVVTLLVGLWVLHLSFKVDKNELLIEILISRDGTHVEAIEELRDRLEELEKRYSNFEKDGGLQLINGFP